MAIDYGRDIKVYPDLSPMFELVEGAALLKQALWCRYTTERGTNPDDPEYGLLLTAMLGDDMTPAKLYAWSRQIEAEAMKDERILSASAAVVFTESTGKARVTIRCESALGPFALVLDVSKVSVEILRGAA